jgi:hypothetical protein
VTSFGYKTTTGQLQSIAVPGETLTYGYDAPLLTSVSWSGAVSGTLTRTYDTSFRVARNRTGRWALLARGFAQLGDQVRVVRRGEGARMGKVEPRHLCVALDGAQVRAQ